MPRQCATMIPSTLGRPEGVPDLAQLAATFEQMGESSAAFFQALSVAQPRFCGFHARQILLLRERYDTADLDGALGHALRFGALEHKPVARILAARAPRTLDEYVADETARHLEAELGHSGTEPLDSGKTERSMSDRAVHLCSVEFWTLASPEASGADARVLHRLHPAPLRPPGCLTVTPAPQPAPSAPSDRRLGRTASAPGSRDLSQRFSARRQALEMIG